MNTGKLYDYALIYVTRTNCATTDLITDFLKNNFNATPKQISVIIMDLKQSDVTTVSEVIKVKTLNDIKQSKFKQDELEMATQKIKGMIERRGEVTHTYLVRLASKYVKVEGLKKVVDKLESLNLITITNDQNGNRTYVYTGNQNQTSEE